MTSSSHFPSPIAIDGPSASGKGTVARLLGMRLNFAILDTGLLYRAVAYDVHQQEKNEAPPVSLIVACAHAFKLERLHDPDFRKLLKTDFIGQMASKFSAFPEVRHALLEAQRQFALNPPAPFLGSILDGRDIGTVICPNAPLKLYITAQDEIRAQRRFKELQELGVLCTFDEVLSDLRVRDARDYARTSSPLKPAEDAYILDTSTCSPEEVVEQIFAIFGERDNFPSSVG